MTTTTCSYCGFIYDEWDGDPKNGIPAGVPAQRLAGTLCSRCGMQGARHKRQPAPRYAGAEAEYYDQFAGKAGIAFYREWLKQSEEPAAALELGVGTGRLAAELAPLSARYCGVDWSPLMLQAADRKRRRLFKEAAAERLPLIEEDALQLRPDSDYTHVLCADGMLQHFALMDDQLALLDVARRALREGGQLAVDIHLPPGECDWRTLQRKRLPQDKLVVRIVCGTTSLVRQLFRCDAVYETYVDGAMTSRYRVEREYALMTPREASLLLAAAGFQVTDVVIDYGRSAPWRTALPLGIGPAEAELDAQETLETAVPAGKSVLPYRDGAWNDGGHFPAMDSASAPAMCTLLARKK